MEAASQISCLACNWLPPSLFTKHPRVLFHALYFSLLQVIPSSPLTPTPGEFCRKRWRRPSPHYPVGGDCVQIDHYINILWMWTPVFLCCVLLARSPRTSSEELSVALVQSSLV